MVRGTWGHAVQKYSFVVAPESLRITVNEAIYEYIRNKSIIGCDQNEESGSHVTQPRALQTTLSISTVKCFPNKSHSDWMRYNLALVSLLKNMGNRTDLPEQPS